MASGKFLGLEAARGVAAIFVVLSHANMWAPVPKPLGGFFSSGTAGVDFFFVLSGFVIAHAHREDLGRPAQLARYAWRRFVRVFPPYWAVTLITLPFVLTIAAIRPDIIWSATYVAQNVILAPMREGYPIVAPAWTLQYEIMFYALFGCWILNVALGRIVFAIWALLIVLGATISLPFPLNFATNPANGEFFIGLLIAVTGWKAGPRVLALGIFLFLSMMAIHGLVPQASAIVDNQVVRRILYGCAAGLIVAGLVGLPIKSAVAEWLGRISFPLYLVHFPLMGLLVLAGVRAPGVLYLVLYLSAAIAGAALFERLIERRLVSYGSRRGRSLPAYAEVSAREGVPVS